MKIRFIVLAFLLSIASTVMGQIDVSKLKGVKELSNKSLSTSNSSNTTSNSSSTVSDTSKKDSTAVQGLKGIEYHVDIPDSELMASVYIFHRLSGQVKIMDVFHPELNPTGAQFSDPLDRLNGDYYLSVTELGHQHYSVFPTFSATPGLIYKSTLFPNYYKTPENVNFYQVRSPYFVLGYHSSLDKAYQLQITHSQNINSHWNYAFDYHLFNPDGTFSNTAATDHIFDFTTNYYSADARYQLSAGAIWQRYVVGENFGLSNPSVFIDKRISNMAGVPVLNNSAASSESDATVFVKQTFNTVRQFEWYRPIKEQYTDTIEVRDTLHIRYFDTVVLDSASRDSIVLSYRYEVLDTIVGYDTIQPHKPHCYNTGVFGLELQWDRQRYLCSDSNIYNQYAASLFWTNDAYMDYRWRNPLKLTGGVRPQYSVLQLNEAYYTQDKIQQSAFYPFAKAEFSPFAAAQLAVYGEAAPNLSEYNLDAKLTFPFRDSVGNSKQRMLLGAVVKAYSPELIYYAACYREKDPHEPQFDAVGVRQLTFDYQRDGLLDVHLAAQHVSHNIWFGETTLSDNTTGYSAVQSDSSALLLQGRVNLYLKLGKVFHLDMQQIVQYSSNQNQIRVPLFASKNSFYSDFYLFKHALRAQVGVDLRYHTAFYADGYDPNLGIFYRQDDELVGNYLWADFFVNLQIKRASIYVKAGHFNTYLEQQGYCIIPGYPTNQFGLYYGLTWKFFD